MKMKFYLLRAKILALIIKLFSAILFVELPPISSSAAIIVRDKKLLVVKLSYRNGYALPGGLVQTGENIEETLIREVKEETGLTVSSMKYFGSFSTNAEVPGVNTTFITETKGEIKVSDEGTLSWEDPKEIVSKMVYKDNVQAINKYFKLK